MIKCDGGLSVRLQTHLCCAVDDVPSALVCFPINSLSGCEYVPMGVAEPSA